MKDLLFQKMDAIDYTDRVVMTNDPTRFEQDDRRQDRHIELHAAPVTSWEPIAWDSTRDNSVVDSFQRSHDHDNLYLVGSGTFPTGATANPTLTIAALALRTADRIAKSLNRAPGMSPNGRVMASDVLLERDGGADMFVAVNTGDTVSQSIRMGFSVHTAHTNAASLIPAGNRDFGRAEVVSVKIGVKSWQTDYRVIHEHSSPSLAARTISPADPSGFWSEKTLPFQLHQFYRRL